MAHYCSAEAHSRRFEVSERLHASADLASRPDIFTTFLFLASLTRYRDRIYMIIFCCVRCVFYSSIFVIFSSLELYEKNHANFMTLLAISYRVSPIC